MLYCKKVQWLLVLVFVSFSESYKILAVFPFPQKSHGILGDGIVRHLLEAGHEVTLLTPFPKEHPPPNLHQVDVSENINVFPMDILNIRNILDKVVDPSDTANFSEEMINLYKATVNNDNVQELLNDANQKFDLVIVEWLFANIGCGFAAVFNCPFIWSSSVEPHFMILSLIDGPSNPSYVPFTDSQNTPPFTFRQRAEELWLQIKTMLIDYFFVSKYESKIYEDVFGPVLAKRGRPSIPLEELKYQASLILGNSHVSIGQALSLPQSYKPIAGYHIKKLKPLPKDLQHIMDHATTGVIYFSMGSLLNSTDLPSSLKTSILDVLGTLPYTVIWKFEQMLPNLPKNVHLMQWVPQQSILAHPNCLLFITHGGLLSTTEAVHHAVPIIGIPVFGDQFTNVDMSVRNGFAKRVDLQYGMADQLKSAIHEVMMNPRYRERVKELSLIYHDRPVQPGKELVHWVEHVVRTKGAPHLRSPALLMPWYQKMYLDLAAVILAVLLIFVKLVTVAFSKCFGRKENKQKVKKQ